MIGSSFRSRINTGDRDGIALVIVIGMLALLLIIGIGFSVTMRVERVAARSFADSIRGRLLLQSTTARLMTDLNNELADSSSPLVVYPNFGNPDSRVLPSPGNGSGIGLNTNLMTPEAWGFIPADIRASVSNQLLNVEWSEIDDADGNVMGHYSFMAVDCSGYLDASMAGNIGRADGKEAGEILMRDIVPEFNGDNTAFVRKLTNEWVTFESYPDLWAVGEYYGLIGEEPQNLFPYSRFVQDGRYDDATKSNRYPTYIGGNEGDIAANVVEISFALQQAGVPNPNEVVENLIDYVDQDVIPQRFDSFCTEPVPMINEIVVSNSVSAAMAGTLLEFTHDVYVSVETWHPFNSDITVTLEPSPSPFNFQVFPPTAGSLQPSAVNLVTGPGTIDHPPFSFRTNAYHYQVKTTAGFAGGNLGLIVTLSGDLNVVHEGNTVDKVPAGAGIPPNALAVAVTAIPNGVSPPKWSAQPKGISVVDPRLNYVFSPGFGWEIQNSLTMGRVNANANVGEGVSPMHVRNRPLGNDPEGSVAELGYLSVGEPWRTIALYKTPVSDMNPVLDFFTIDANPKPVRGKVNINSPRRQAVASVLNGMTVSPVPGSNTTTLTWGQAQAYAEGIYTRTSARSFTNISEFGDFDRNFYLNLLGLGTGVTDAEIESLIRKSYELFGIRQNLFTVILSSRLIGRDGFPASEQRAVAVVWRDPIPNANGHHASFVRFYKHIVE